MEYKGYLAGPIDFDAEDGSFSGVVLGLKDVIHFEGSNAAELRASFESGIDDYLAQCAEAVPLTAAQEAELDRRLVTLDEDIRHGIDADVLETELGHRYR